MDFPYNIFTFSEVIIGVDARMMIVAQLVMAENGNQTKCRYRTSPFSCSTTQAFMQSLKYSMKQKGRGSHCNSKHTEQNI